MKKHHLLVVEKFNEARSMVENDRLKELLNDLFIFFAKFGQYFTEERLHQVIEIIQMIIDLQNELNSTYDINRFGVDIPYFVDKLDAISTEIVLFKTSLQV